MIKILKLTLLIFSLFFINNSLFSQFKNLSITSGISTISILGDNPGAKSIIERDTTKEPIYGGSFKTPQACFSFQVNVGLDDENKFIVPIGFEYVYFNALERIPAATQLTVYLRHSISVPTFYTGFQYQFMKFPLANVKAYAGLEARASFVQEGVFYRRFYYHALDSSFIYESKTKDAATRFGAVVRLGFQGEVIDPWFVNFSAAYGVMNLLGRDDKRGELLTPLTNFETKESLVFNFHLALLIQYRL
jgi:hypothetical protein